MFKLDLEKAEESEIKLSISLWSSKNQENSRKMYTSASWTTLKHLTVWTTTNCGKFFKRWEYQSTLLAFWEICMQVKKQYLERNLEQGTGSKLGKEYIKAVCCHPAYLTYMQSTPYDMPGWMKHKLESRLPGEISITSDMQMTPPLFRKWRGTKKPLDESERGEWKSWLKAQHSEPSGPITSWEIDGETVETVSDFIFLGSKITAGGDCSHEIKRCLLLRRKFIQPR